MPRSVLAFLLLTITLSSIADVVNVGVASNFSPAFSELKSAFEATSEHQLREITGSSGKLFAQIVHGAPVDLFLAADSKRPLALVERQIVEQESTFVYAIGRLALWSRESGLKIDQDNLNNPAIRHIAIANPKTAPYGTAAMDVIKQLELSASLASKIVYGENVNQAHHFAQIGNADFAFVGLSQAQQTGNGSYWEVPRQLHQPIIQSAAIVLSTEASRAFVAFLKSAAAARILTESGYTLP